MSGQDSYYPTRWPELRMEEEQHYYKELVKVMYSRYGCVLSIQATTRLRSSVITGQGEDEDDQLIISWEESVGLN